MPASQLGADRNGPRELGFYRFLNSLSWPGTYLGRLLLVSDADYLRVFDPEQLQALAQLFLNVFSSGFMIAQIFFAAWLLPLGYLVYRSGFLPRFLGVLLLLDFIVRHIRIALPPSFVQL